MPPSTCTPTHPTWPFHSGVREFPCAQDSYPADFRRCYLAGDALDLSVADFRHASLYRLRPSLGLRGGGPAMQLQQDTINNLCHHVIGQGPGFLDDLVNGHAHGRNGADFRAGGNCGVEAVPGAAAGGDGTTVGRLTGLLKPESVQLRLLTPSPKT